MAAQLEEAKVLPGNSAIFFLDGDGYLMWGPVTKRRIGYLSYLGRAEGVSPDRTFRGYYFGMTGFCLFFFW